MTARQLPFLQLACYTTLRRQQHRLAEPVGAAGTQTTAGALRLRCSAAALLAAALRRRCNPPPPPQPPPPPPPATHGSLTGLCSAMYLDRGREVACPDPHAGLHVRVRPWQGDGSGG